jgi:threonyl-tRNA synthetase
VDDRDETLAKRVRDAETSWIPYIVAIGKQELQKKSFPVRVRGEKEPRDLTLNELISEIKGLVKGYPYRAAYFPHRLSLRPSLK